jgi:Lipocalin-like domain
MKNAIFLLVIFLLSSCKGEDKTPILLGDWRGIKWTSGNQDTNRTESDLFFHFAADGTYRTSFGTQKEAGTFRLDGSKLYTTAEATQKIEKVVMLSTLTQDTLVMDMNRAGQPEQLTLVRK